MSAEGSTRTQTTEATEPVLEAQPVRIFDTTRFVDADAASRHSRRYYARALLVKHGVDRLPVDHLETYKAHMNLQAVSNEIMCKAFPTALNKSARRWFST
jgi:hypothetical protein